IVGRAFVIEREASFWHLHQEDPLKGVIAAPLRMLREQPFANSAHAQSIGDSHDSWVGKANTEGSFGAFVLELARLESVDERLHAVARAIKAQRNQLEFFRIVCI